MLQVPAGLLSENPDVPDADLVLPLQARICNDVVDNLVICSENASEKDAAELNALAETTRAEALKLEQAQRSAEAFCTTQSLKVYPMLRKLGC